jgi:hypothetical protein
VFPRGQLYLLIKGTREDAAIFVRWDATASTPSGRLLHNHGLQFTRMHQGKFVEQDIVSDSQVVADLLEEKFKAGEEEAGAKPIVSA